MSKYNAIKINKGPSGFGGPLTVKPTEEKNVLLSSEYYLHKIVLQTTNNSTTRLKRNIAKSK